MLRELINHSTRSSNMELIKKEGVDSIQKMLNDGLKCVEDFRHLLVYMFQEVVIDIIALDIFNILNKMEHSVRECVLFEIANRYVKFAQLGYVFTIKNYLDGYSY